MFKHKNWLNFGLFAALLALSACTNKEIPQGKRIAIWEQQTTVKPDVSNGSSQIKIADSVSVENWLQNDYNSAHVAPNAKTGTSFTRQWKNDFGTGRSKRELLMAKPLIKNQTVYTLDAEGSLSAFELSTGKNIWTVDLIAGNNYVGETAMKGVGLAIANNTIYITTGYGTVIAAKTSDGSKIWEKNLRVPLRIAPTVAAGKIFVQSANNHFFALDAANGETLWDFDIAMESTTLVGGAPASYCSALDVVITGFSNGEIQAFGATIGTPLWDDNLVANRQAYSSTALHTIKASSVIEGEKAYALGSADVLAAIDIRNGTRLWEKSIGGTQTPLLSGNTLFIVTNNNELVALDKNNGNVLWAQNIDLGKHKDVSVYAPVMLNNRLIIAVSDGRVMSYDPQNGQKIEETDLDEELNSAPIAAQGYVLFTTSNAKIIAYK